MVAVPGLTVFLINNWQEQNMSTIKNNDLEPLLDDVAALIRKAAHPKRRTIAVSPETAALLENLNSTAEPPPPAPSTSAPTPPSLTEVEAATCPEAEALAALAQVVTVCEKCGLQKTRTQTVFGTGNPRSRLVFVGEAPGADEDAQGKPFVGRAGQLLTDIIEKGMGLNRSEVYICNVLKCRPPGNRDPLPEEKRLCEMYLMQQLAILKPAVICALGTHAAQTLLRTDAGIGQLRGAWHFYQGIPLRATYHPAYLLRSPGEKRKTWMDVLEVLKVYNGEFTPKP